MTKYKTFLFLIFILAFFLRIFKLAEFPIGFYSDEAAFSYNAYSLLKTGADEFGVHSPLVLKSFGDYKSPLYSYYLIPFVFFLDLSEFSVRLGSAALGIISVYLTYLIARLVSGNKKIALMSGFFMSISPFSLQFSRMVHENNLALVLILSGILLFFHSIKRPYLWKFSSILFALSIYAYHDAKIITPLFLFLIFLFYKNIIRKFKNYFLTGLAVFFVVVLPFLYLSPNREIWSRAHNTSIFYDPGLFWKTNAEVGESLKLNFPQPKLFHNKYLVYSFRFLSNYLSHFDPLFLFIKGDNVQIYQTAENGLFYPVQLPLLLIGSYYFFRNKIFHRRLFLAWILIAPIPASLTKLTPSASRTLTLLPPLIILISIGIVQIIRQLGKKIPKIYSSFLFSFVFIFSIAYFQHFYYFNTPVRYAKEWHYGLKQVMTRVKEIEQNYDYIWLSKNAWGYIYPLFYLKYPPQKYQPQAKLGPPDQYGFGWIDGFDKYLFRPLPKYFDFEKPVLYIVIDGELPENVSPLHTIFYPDGQPAFIIADSSRIKHACPDCDILLKPKNVDIYGHTKED